MSDDWRTVPASSVARIEIGGTPAREQPRFWSDAENGHAWASIADLRAHEVAETAEYISDLGVRSSNVKLVPAGTPIMSFKLTIGRTSITGRDLFTNEAIAAFFSDPKQVDPRYLLHLLPISARSVITDVAIKGATLNKKSLSSMRLLLPPIEEQRRILEVLDAIDGQIQATERIMAKWQFVKSGLVSDLMEGCSSDHRLGDLAEHITSGSRGWAKYYSDDGAKFIRIGNLTRSHINLRFDSLIRVAVPSGAEGSRTGLLPGDLLISITADLGIVGVVPRNLGEAYINQHIALVRVNPAKADSRWVAHYLASSMGQAQFVRLNDQGAKAGLNLPTIGNLRVPLPSRSNQTRTALMLDEVDARVAQISVEIEKLKSVKEGLTADLLSGRVRVPSGAGS